MHFFFYFYLLINNNNVVASDHCRMLNFRPVAVASTVRTCTRSMQSNRWEADATVDTQK